MRERQPSATRNLDRYDHEVFSWSRAHDALAAGPKGPLAGYFLGTVSPDGRPHVAGVGAMCHDGDLYFTSGPGTRKSQNLAANPSCTFAVRLPGIDLTLEGEAERVRDHGLLEALADRYRDLGWPSEVDGDALTAPFSAPSAGPPPWHLFRFRFTSVVGVGTTDPSGATLWLFDR